MLRRFERFTGAEVRTWWIDGRCALVGPHPDTPDAAPAAEVDLGFLSPLVAPLGLPFGPVWNRPDRTPAWPGIAGMRRGAISAQRH